MFRRRQKKRSTRRKAARRRQQSKQAEASQAQPAQTEDSPTPAPRDVVCPRCSRADSRPYGHVRYRQDGIHRTRVCKGCGWRFDTVQAHKEGSKEVAA